MKQLKLTKEENQQINTVLDALLEQYSGPCDEQFLLQARTYANKLPQSVLRTINEYRYQDDHNGILLFTGFHVDDKAIGLTPDVTGRELDENSAPREGFMLMLLISFLGDAFGWGSQRDGALINNVLPLKSHENEQLSTGSVTDLDWHTEEAFHPYRADYLALMCMRNHDRIPTQLASIQDIQVSEAAKKILFQPRFVFETDKNFQGDEWEITADPVFFGSYQSPYVRIDPSFMQAQEGDAEAAAALKEITTSFAGALHDVVLEQGDVVLLDNYRVVHGRKGFKPRFDGADRWLKRVNITLDLRKSRALRRNNNSRVIAAN